jgi:hypothetical protein
MNILHRGFRMSALAVVASLGMTAAAFAQHGGGGGGGHGGGGGGHGGGFAGGHAAGYSGGGYRGGYGGYGYRGGYRGGYGGYGGYGGWRGGYYGGYHGGYGGWGWGLGYGAFLATLPLYYSTWWWGGVPYYYAYHNYYLWNPSAGGYVTVTPPPEVASQATGQGSGAQAPSTASLFAYPKNGQTSAQQATDRFECHRWAVAQTGFDPTLAGGDAPAKGQDYRRAQVACLEGRGYSVQ